MKSLKLSKQLFFITLLVSLVSFSSFANTIPIERTTIELVLAKASEHRTFYAFKDRLNRKNDNQNLLFCRHYFGSLLNYKHDLDSLAYANFKEKYIPIQNTVLIFKYQYYSTSIDRGPVI
jgi:hypothetical protein